MAALLVCTCTGDESLLQQNRTPMLLNSMSSSSLDLLAMPLPTTVADQEKGHATHFQRLSKKGPAPLFSNSLNSPSRGFQQK